MAEVAGLTTAISDRILEQNDAGLPIPPEHFRMLVQAARMLLDNGVPWPPSLERVIMEVAQRVEEAESTAARGDREPCRHRWVKRSRRVLIARHRLSGTLTIVDEGSLESKPCRH